MVVVVVAVVVAAAAVVAVVVVVVVMTAAVVVVLVVLVVVVVVVVVVAGTNEVTYMHWPPPQGFSCSKPLRPVSPVGASRGGAWLAVDIVHSYSANPFISTQGCCYDDRYHHYSW